MSHAVRSQSAGEIVASSKYLLQLIEGMVVVAVSELWPQTCGLTCRLSLIITYLQCDGYFHYCCCNCVPNNDACVD